MNDFVDDCISKHSPKRVKLAVVYATRVVIHRIYELGIPVYDGFDANETLLSMIEEQSPEIPEFEEIAYDYCRRSKGTYKDFTRCIGRTAYALTYDAVYNAEGKLLFVSRLKATTNLRYAANELVIAINGVENLPASHEQGKHIVRNLILQFLD